MKTVAYQLLKLEHHSRLLSSLSLKNYFSLLLAKLRHQTINPVQRILSTGEKILSVSKNMLADLSTSWGLLFLPTNLQKSTLSEDRPILLICSSPAISFVAVAFHRSTLHSLTHCCLTVIWNHRKQKYPWGIKRNYEVKSEKTWKEMSCLNLTPLFCTILLHWCLLPSRETRAIWSFWVTTILQFLDLLQDSPHPLPLEPT